MIQNLVFSRVVVAGVLATLGYGQTPAPKPVVGTVVSADIAAKMLVLKADDGTETKVKVADNARISQIPPGETSLTNAKPAELSAVSAGDRVLARGASADGVMTATLVVLMSKTEIAKKQQQEQALWATKGVSGMVTAVDKGAKTVTINYRTPEGVKPLKIALSDKAAVKRYAEGSVKYADATVSELSDIEVSDQVRALGTKSEDGASYTADQMISGAFRNIAATIKSIDVANGTIEVTDLDTKKPLQIKITKDTNLKKLNEMAAQMMAMQINGTGGMPGARSAPGGMAMRPPQAAGTAPTAGTPGAGAPGTGAPGTGAPGAGGPGMGGPGMSGPGGGMRRPPGGDMASAMIERSPAIKLTDLTKNEPLILSCSKTKDASKMVAITLIAGVEPILATPANGSRAAQLGTWNLDGGAGMMGGGGGGGPQ